MSRRLRISPLLFALIAIAGGGFAQGKEPALSANTIISRWTEAVGGAQRVAAVKTVYRTSESDEDGLKGTRQEWITRKLKRREHVDHVRDQSTTVFNGKQGWLLDWNGKTQTLHGDDLKLIQALAIIHSFAALRGGAGAAESLGDDPSGKLAMLRFSPPDGFPITYYFDRATFLPVKAEIPAFDGTETISFRDWREVNGLKVPFEEKQADPVNTTELHMKEVTFNSPTKVSYVRPAGEPHDAFFVSNPAAPVPFNFENKHVLLPTMINGQGPIFFILDTGSGQNIINQSRLEQFHLHTYGALTTEGGANSVSGSYLQSLSLRVGGVEVRNQHASALPLDGLEKVFGLPVGGLLGYDFISRFVLTLNYRNDTISFSDPKKFHYRGPGASIPLLMQTSEPYMHESITEKGQTIPALFVLDIGAADTLNLTSGFVKEHNLTELAGDPNQKPKSLAGSEKEFFGATSVRGLIDELHLGPYTLHHVIGNLSVGTHGAYASNTFAGTVGETTYARFNNLILDYARERVILEPGPDLEAPFKERRSFGLTLLSDEPDFKTFRVTAVGANSPAAKAGFQKGDVITEVNSIAPGDLTMAKLLDLLSKDGQQQVFTVKRNSEEVKIPATIETVPISGLT